MRELIDLLNEDALSSRSIRLQIGNDRIGELLANKVVEFCKGVGVEAKWHPDEDSDDWYHPNKPYAVNVTWMPKSPEDTKKIIGYVNRCMDTLMHHGVEALAEGLGDKAKIPPERMRQVVTPRDERHDAKEWGGKHYFDYREPEKPAAPPRKDRASFGKRG